MEFRDTIMWHCSRKVNSRFSCVAPGMERYSLDLPRALKNRDMLWEWGLVVYLDCECMEFVITG